jgi:hypothetical protein
MDAYVTTILGLPRTLSDDDIDQELPLEIDDKYITEDDVGTNKGHSTCLMTAANAHTKLILIMASIRRNVLCSRNSSDSLSDQNEAYRVDYSRIMQAENELEEWFAKLPGDSNFPKPLSGDSVKYVTFTC